MGSARPAKSALQLSDRHESAAADILQAANRSPPGARRWPALDESTAAPPGAAAPRRSRRLLISESRKARLEPQWVRKAELGQRERARFRRHRGEAAHDIVRIAVGAVRGLRERA